MGSMGCHLERSVGKVLASVGFISDQYGNTVNGMASGVNVSASGVSGCHIASVGSIGLCWTKWDQVGCLQ